MKLAVGTALSLFVLFCVIKTSAVDGVLRSAPAAAAAIGPTHPDAQMALLASQLGADGSNVSGATRKRAREALALAPLAAEPFLMEALQASGGGREVRAQSLLEEARRRNPRQVATRMFLLDRYMAENRVPEAAVELRQVRALVPDILQVLALQLTQVLENPRAERSVGELLRSDPELRDAVLSRLASSGGDPDLILRLAGSGPAASGTGNPAPAWQPALLSSLVGQGDVAKALSVWRQSAGLQEGGRKGVYDGRFTGLPGSAPFAWTLYSGTAGVAERVRPGGLSVEFFGREVAEFASQMMVLPPGRYRLSLRAEGSAKGDDSRLAWQVLCRNSSEPLLEVPVRGVTYKPVRLGGQFVIPAGCDAQILRLVGIVGEFPGQQTATMNDVAVVPVGVR